jgi:hypothetical protein
MKIRRGWLRGTWKCLAAALLLGVFWLPPATAAAEKPTQQPSAVEARADALLRQMGALLSSTPRFVLEAEETFDEIGDDTPRIALTNIRRVAVQRPDRLAADASGDTLNRATWYDGRQLTALDKAHNTYMTLSLSGSIDSVLDRLADEYNLHLPLADLLYADPHAVLMEGVTYGRYLGLHLAAGVLCHHLVFSQPSIEWQIWIEAGDTPLPRKLVITYVDEPGEPQYSATIRKWLLDAELPQRLFEFEPPEEAHQVSPAAISRPALPGQGRKGGDHETPAR